MIFTLAIEIQGEQHNIAMLHNQYGDEPDISEKEIEALYHEYCRLGRTLSNSEACWILEVIHVLH